MFAIVSDIHGNLEALEVVLADSREQKCTHYCCVGDVVGYGANPKECLDIVRQMCEGLHYAHQKGMLHRDIKPANIMAIGDQLKVSTDGVVRRDQASGARFTPSLYDSPEARSTGFSLAGDVWSLGMTLVEVLTQRPPVIHSCSAANLSPNR